MFKVMVAVWKRNLFVRSFIEIKEDTDLVYLSSKLTKKVKKSKINRERWV